MWNKCKVVMLPTNEKANKGDIIGNDKGLTIVNETEIYLLKELSLIQAKVYRLYILSDEEGKEGDWVYCSNGNIKKITRSNIDDKFIENWKKIIATTDRSLSTNSSDKNYKYLHYLPQIPEPFIEHFVTEYNKGNVITEVMVEYEESTKTIIKSFPASVKQNYQLKINPDNTINIIINIPEIDKTYTKEDFKNAIHKVELLENRNYSKLWKKIEEYL